MRIQIGAELPNHDFLRVDVNGNIAATSIDQFRNQRVVILGIPGAFTPKCSNVHIPSFVSNAARFKALDVQVAVCAVNDHWVLNAWLCSLGASDFTALCDWNAAYVTKLGLHVDFSSYNMGLRSQRFALAADRGRVQQIFVDEGGVLEDTLADNVLQHLSGHNAEADV